MPMLNERGPVRVNRVVHELCKIWVRRKVVDASPTKAHREVAVCRIGTNEDIQGLHVVSNERALGESKEQQWSVTGEGDQIWLNRNEMKRTEADSLVLQLLLIHWIRSPRWSTHSLLEQHQIDPLPTQRSCLSGGLGGVP